MLSIIQSESGVLIKKVWILTKLGRCGKECSDIHPKYYFVWSWPAGGATWQAFWQTRVFAVLGWKLRGSDCGKELTGNSEDISLNLSGDVHATSPLGVVCPTQAGHVGHAALMDVHHTVWRQTQREMSSPIILCLLHDSESVRWQHIRSHLMPWCIRP